MERLEMESLRIGEVVAISRYWTPHHIDVTERPAHYAPPKRSWLDARSGTLALSDPRDRVQRRWQSLGAVIDPQEIGELSTYTAPEVPRTPPMQRFFEGVRATSRAFAQRAYR